MSEHSKGPWRMAACGEELEAKLLEAEGRARTAAAREDAANIYARQQDAELAQVRRAHLHELAERQKAEERVEKAERRADGAEYEVGMVKQEKAELLDAYDKLREAKEVAERERDAARAEMVALKRRLEWASKDAHVAHGAPAHVGPWEQCDIDSCTKDRAALGEKP